MRRSGRDEDVALGLGALEALGSLPSNRFQKLMMVSVRCSGLTLRFSGGPRSGPSAATGC